MAMTGVEVVAVDWVWPKSCRASGLLERVRCSGPACGGPLILVVRVRHEGVAGSVLLFR